MKVLMLVLALLWTIAGRPAYAQCGKHRVQIYSAYWCSICRTTEQFLSTHKIKYRRSEVMGNAQVQKLMLKKFGVIAVPVVVIDGRHRFGYQPDWIRKTLCIREPRRAGAAS
jgi:glutaredoxin